MGAVRDEGVVGRCGELSEDEEADPEKLCSRFSPKLLDGEAESRTCGICSIVVQTRGLLDCCSHLFCFGCITEWFTVSNLCPLCKSRSRFITPQMLSRGTGCWEKLESCTGSVSRDEGPGDEDGHPVSFPPYFIDEEAVLCLEGDACLVRAGLLDLDAEENASSDTSVACDLCDCWYHGGCVNFQPDQSSFHCPRCLESKEKDRASLDTSVSLTVTSSEEKTSTVMKNFPSEDNGRTMFGGASVAIEDTEEGESHVSISLLRIPEREPARAQTTAPDTEREIMWSPIREPFATPAYGAAWSHFQEPSRRPRNFNEGLPSSAREPTRNVPYFEEEMWSPTREPSGKVPQFQEELWSPTRETPGDLSLLGARSRNNAATAKSFRAANPPKPELNARGPRVVVPTRSELLNNSERIAKHSAGVVKKVTASEISGATLPLNTMDNIVQPLGVIKGELSIDVDRLQVAVEQLRKGKRKVLQEDERNIDFKDLPELPRKVARKSTKIVDSVAAIKDIAKTGTRDLIVCEQTAVEDVNPPAQVCTLDDKTVVASEDTLKVATDVVKEEALDTQHAQAIDAPIHLHVSERKTEVDGLDDKSRVISEEISKVVTEVETAGQITPCLKSLDDLATKTESTEVRNEEQLATLQSEEPTAPETKTEIPTLEACPDVDVMDIVSDPRSGLGRDSRDPSVPTKAVRTRIIMHRESDVKDNERPSLVERIRQQMRDTAGYGAGDDLGKVEVSDDRFIAAFKAAQTRSYEKSKDGKSASSRQQSSGRLWKVLDKKYSGTGARDNLTRKLYAGGTGRRCWDRDWDIAFWRERDPHQRRARKEAEEVDVLGKIDARVPESQPDSEDADFFKRLYVADTSLFPRNENVKPLSEEGNHAEEINASQSVEIRTGKISNLHVDNVNLAHGLKDTAHQSPVSQGLSGNTPGIDKISQKAKVGDPPPSKVVKKSLRPSGVSKEPAVNSKTTSGAGKSLVAPSTVPKAQHKDKDAPSALPSMNKDKRQWALEILARKEGKLSNVSASGKGAGAGGSVSKDNPFPLLLQLPVEMRPLILGDSRRSKVPPAVRQVQLNRLVEQELKRANLKIIESNSECADAIAKAVSREEELCKSSNSKGVYINRCVRALANTDYELKTVETSPDDDRDESEARLEESSRVTDDEAVRKALEDTGLMDSPTADSTSSPHHLDVNTREDKLDVKCKTLDMNGGSSIPRLVQNPWVENVLEVENADLDIYGDFEFSSEDEPDGNLFKENIQKLKHNPAAEGKAKNGSLMVVLTTGSCTSDAASVPGDAEVPAKNLVGKQPVQEQGGALLCSEDGGLRASTSPTVEDVKCGLPAEASFDDVDDMYDNLELNLNPVLSNEVLAQLQAEPSASLLSKAESKETHEESKTLPAPNADVKKRKENETLPNGDAAANENVSEDDCMKFADIDRRIENIRRSKAMNGDSHRNKKSKGRVHGEAKKTTETNVQMQVEIYVNQHLKPLYRSQVITAEQFKWTVSKTAAKVMEHHGNAVSADFLISEGSKVKKLADQYLQAFAHRKA